MTLECSFKVEGLIASVDHLLGFFLEYIILAVRTRLIFWFRLAGLNAVSCPRRCIRWFFDSAEKSSDVVLLVAIVEERDFGLVRSLCRNCLLLHGFGLPCPNHLCLPLLHLIQLFDLGCIRRVHILCSWCSHLCSIDIVHVLSVSGCESFTGLMPSSALLWYHFRLVVCICAVFILDSNK